MELSVDDATVVGRSHPFSMRLLWVNNEGTGPQVHIMKDSSGFHKTPPVHVLQNADAVHGDHSAEAESDYGDSFAIKLVSLE